MTDRPRRLTFAATLVLRACTELTLAEKTVWLEDHAFDRGVDGAFVSAKSLAARWGGSLSPKTVELARNHLKHLGLHERIRRPGARNVFGWFSTLPDACIPHTARPASAEVAALAGRLDEHIRRIGKPELVTTAQTEVIRNDDHSPDSGHRAASSASSIPREGGKGGGSPSSSSRSETPLPPAVTDLKEEDGVVAHATNNEEGDRSNVEISPRARAMPPRRLITDSEFHAKLRHLEALGRAESA